MTPERTTTQTRERITLAICCTALFMTTLDNTVLNVALPSLQHSFHASLSQLQWAADAYLLGRACTLFIAGSVSDRYGRRLFFNIGQMLFVGGSIACALSPNLNLLIAARVLQAVGSSLMTPSGLAIISDTFSAPERRARALGIWNASSGVSIALGPLFGGLLVDSFGWRSVFWINVPIGIAALIGTRGYLRESKARIARPFDFSGQAVMGLVLVALSYGLIEAPNDGWTSAIVLGALGVVIVGAVGFVVIERAVKSPLLEFSDFRNPPLTGAILLAIIIFIVTGGFPFLNTLYLQEVRGFTPVLAALVILPQPVMSFLLAPTSGTITGRRGPRLPATAALVLTTCGMGLATFVTTPAIPIVAMLCCYFLLGCGGGLINTPITNAAITGMPHERAGVAAATASTARQVGISLGIALMGSIAFTAGGIRHLNGRAHHPVSHAIALRFTDGLHYSFGTAAVLCALSIPIALWAFRPSVLRIQRVTVDPPAPLEEAGIPAR